MSSEYVGATTRPRRQHSRLAPLNSNAFVKGGGKRCNSAWCKSGFTVLLVNQDKEQMEADFEKIHEIEKNSLFEIRRARLDTL